MKSVLEQTFILVMLGSEFYEYDGFLQEIVQLFLKIFVNIIIKSIQNTFRTGLPNLCHVCPKWHTERFPWHMTFTAVPFLCLMSFSRHISDCVETVYELPLLPPNNTANETFLYKSGAVGSADLVFITGASAWR